jgi:putative transposase
MPRSIRSFVPGGTYFFTVSLADRESHMLVREIQRLRTAYAAVQSRYPFETRAICVLPDHLHTVWQLPEGDADFPLRWQQIKSGFSEGLPASANTSESQAARRERGIWQRRFWEHQIRDADDLVRHVDYVHFNPVKHGCAKQVRDWPFSSFHRWVRRGELPAKWGLVEAAGNGGRFGERGDAGVEVL